MTLQKNLINKQFVSYLVIIASHELLNEVANMEEYSMKFANEYLTYPRTFGKEMGTRGTYWN